MQTANVILALGGDKRNTVPKHVTAAEIPVLLMIHGSGSVFDIEPSDEDVDRSAREEVGRLAALYRARDDDNRPVVGQLYGGANPSLPQTLEDLNLDEAFYKAETRKTPKKSSGRKQSTRSKAKASDDKSDDSDDDADDDKSDQGVMS